MAERTMPLLICPNCQTVMDEIDRGAVHVDVCPKCRGVWLDRGELDKLLAAAREEIARERAERAPPPRGDAGYDPRAREQRYDDDRRRYDDERHYKKRKRKSPWEDILDIFD